MSVTAHERGNDVVVADLLQRGFHSVVFQPIRRLSNGSLFGFEALMRGPVGTPLAEPSQIFREGALARPLLHQLDIACFYSAVRLGRLVASQHRLFINMHGETLLRSVSATDELFSLLDTLRIPPSQLVIEISEMTDRSHVRAIGRSLRRVRANGASIALDDIGSRYAWLHHMLWLEPDFLKLDRSFVRGVARSQRRRDLIAGMIDFARRSGADVIAEGIEHDEELETLRGCGLSLGQGYLLGIPLPAQECLTGTVSPESARVAGLIE